MYSQRDSASPMLPFPQAEENKHPGWMLHPPRLAGAPDPLDPRLREQEDGEGLLTIAGYDQLEHVRLK